jgi:hypothetical protein
VKRTLLAAALLAIPAAAGGPQHYGFGQGYLASLETRDDGGADLVVCAAPLRAKDGPWLARWRFDGIVSPGETKTSWVAVGDFAPKTHGKALLALVELGQGLDVTLFDPPESFSTRAWKTLPAKSRTIPAEALKGVPLYVAAGNLLASESDRLVVLAKTSDAADAQLRIVWVTAPAREDVAAEVVGMEPLPLGIPAANVTGFAVGDFWGTGQDAICVAETAEGRTVLHFLRWGAEVSPAACFVKVCDDAARDVPPLAPGGLCAGDFVRDGFDALFLVPAEEAAPAQVRVAPRREAGEKQDLGPLYTGRALSRQPLPGFAGASSALAMSASPQALAGRGRVSIGAGPVFGMVKGDLTKEGRAAQAVSELPDAEIAFVHRTPECSLEGAPGFGWPAKNEPVTWTVWLKNNGGKEIEAHSVLRVWVCSPVPNPDTLPGAKPDREIRVPEEIRPWDAEKFRYVDAKIESAWPYALEECPGGKWKRLDLGTTGERWLVIVLSAPGDTNERNNRIEIPWHGVAFRPLLRSTKPCPDRKANVSGDPPSLDYLAWKLADALTCMWERGGTAANEDPQVAVYYGGFEPGWPDDLKEPEKTARWKALRARWELVRQLDGWWSEGQNWERFGWADGSGELLETAKLLHPVGDLAAYAVSPVSTSLVTTGDLKPVSMSTTCWGPDIRATGHAVFGLPAAECARRFLRGTRGVKFENWWETAPEKVFVRVLDRTGCAVKGATVTLTPYGKGAPLKSGLTDELGLFDSGHPFAAPVSTDTFGRKHWNGGLNSATSIVITVSIGAHHESTILGLYDPAPHGRLALFYHSMVHETGWHYDVRLNWIAGAPPPDFTVDSAVQGSMVELSAAGPPGSTFRVYRRWTPSYLRTFLGEYPTGGLLTLPLDLSARDSWGKDRTRALYEVTRMTPSGESSPRSISAVAVQRALGLSLYDDRRLLVANANAADPYGLLFGSVVHERELVAHPRPGHAARRFVRSKNKPSRVFVTLASSDADPDRLFEILDTPQGGIAAQNDDLGSLTTKRSSTKTFRCRDEAQLGELNPGDQITCGGKTARVVSIKPGPEVTVDKPIFDPDVDTVTMTFQRRAGLAGTNYNLRELNAPRGMCTVKAGDAEFIVICDTGNGRLVVWDATTKYLTGYGGENFRPCGVGNDPRDARQFFVVDRRTDRKSHLLRFTFNGRALERDHTWNLDVGDWNGEEQGISVTPTGDEYDRVRLAVTDGEKGRVLTFIVTPDRLIRDPDATEVTGPHSGPGTLVAPLDCLFVPEGKTARLFAVDARDRIVGVTWGKK